MAKISVKHALTPRQRAFAEFVHASDGHFVSRAYKQAFCVYREEDGAWVVLEDLDIDLNAVSIAHRKELLANAQALTTKQIEARGRDMIRKNELVMAYMAELRASPIEIAEQRITEEMLRGDAAPALRAAEQQLKDRDRVGFREGVDRFWEVSAEAGATVVLPFPGEARKTVICPCGCGHEHEVVIPIESRFPGRPALPAEEEGVVVTVKDLEERRAYIEYSPEAKIKLLHMAGAPWSEVDPDAKLSELQVEWYQHKERIKILHGGSGVGKSIVGAGDAVLATMIPYNIVGVIGAMFDNVEKEFRYIDQAFRKLFKNGRAFLRIACISRNNYHDFEVSPIWGSTCFGYSMESNDGRSVLGDTLHHATISEGAQLSSSIMNKRILRALDRAVMVRPGVAGARETGTLTIPTTPDEHRGAGCSAELVEERRRSTKRDLSKLAYGRTSYISSFWFREASVLENPAYNAEVYHERKATMKAHEFEEVYEGKMTFASGRVYHQFLESKHVVQRPSRAELQAMRFGLGIDTGAMFGAVLVGIDPQKRCFVLGEAFTEKETIETSAQAVADMLLRELPYDYVELDALQRALARVDLHVVDPASQFKLDLAAHLPGFRIDSPTRGEGKFDLLPTISQVGEMFAADRLFIVEGCEWLLDEIRKYIWKSQRSPARQGQYFVREPARDHDHLLDALRYVVIPLSELGPLEKPTQEGLRDAYMEMALRRVHGPLRKIMERAERRGGIRV